LFLALITRHCGNISLLSPLSMAFTPTHEWSLAAIIVFTLSPRRFPVTFPDFTTLYPLLMRKLRYLLPFGFWQEKRCEGYTKRIIDHPLSLKHHDNALVFNFGGCLLFKINNRDYLLLKYLQLFCKIIFIYKYIKIIFLFNF